MRNQDRLESAALAILHSTTSITGIVTQKAIDAAVEGAQLLHAKLDAIEKQEDEAQIEASGAGAAIADEIKKRADPLEMLLLSEFLSMGIEYGPGTVSRLASTLKHAFPALIQSATAGTTPTA